MGKILDFLNTEIRVNELNTNEKNRSFFEGWLKATAAGLAFHLFVNIFLLLVGSFKDFKIKLTLFSIHFFCILWPVAMISNLILTSWFHLLNLNNSYYIYAWSVISVLFFTITDAIKTL
jgi:hypothetical protein